MGGYFSTGWNGIRTRLDTAGLLYLDMATLRRMGALAPGARAWHEWTDGHGNLAGSIQTLTHAAGDALTLNYRVYEPDGKWDDIRERVDLDTTPCHYGGRRTWFLCPSCGCRRRVLYSVAGRFRCRACHDLAYPSTRESELERSARRIAALHERLGAPRADSSTIPPRPKGVRHRTYRWIVDALTREQDQEMAYFHAVYERRTRAR